MWWPDRRRSARSAGLWGGERCEMRRSWRVPSGGVMQGDGGVRARVRETANPACGAHGGRPIFSLLLRYRRVAWEKSATSRMMPWSQKCVLLSQYGSQYLTLASSLGSDTFRSYIRDFRGGQLLGPNPLTLYGVCVAVVVNTLRETDGTWDNGREHAWTQIHAALRPRGRVQCVN